MVNHNYDNKPKTYCYESAAMSPSWDYRHEHECRK